MYANSRFKKSTNEYGQVDEYIVPGQKISKDDLKVSDEEWEYLVSTGAVVESYPEVDEQTPPAQYYRNNPDLAPAMNVDASTPVSESLGKLDNSLQSGLKRPGADTGQGKQGGNEGATESK